MSSRALRACDEVEHVLGGDGVGRGDEVAVEAEFGAGLHLAAHVDFRGGHVADEHGGEAGANALGGEAFYFLGDFLLDLSGDGGAIENPGHSCLQDYRIV